MRFRYWFMLGSAVFLATLHFQVSVEQLRPPCSLEVSWPSQLDEYVPAAMDTIVKYSGQTWRRVDSGGNIEFQIGGLEPETLGRTQISHLFDRVLPATVVIDMSQNIDTYATVLHEAAHAAGYWVHSTNPDSFMYPYLREGQVILPEDMVVMQAAGQRCYKNIVTG